MNALNEFQKKVLKCSILQWGSKNQAIVTIEELSELQKAITKILRIDKAAYNPNNKINLVEEMADVYISLECLQEVFNINDSDIKNIIVEKINRISNRLTKEITDKE